MDEIPDLFENNIAMQTNLTRIKMSQYNFILDLMLFVQYNLISFDVGLKYDQDRFVMLGECILLYQYRTVKSLIISYDKYEVILTCSVY